MPVAHIHVAQCSDAQLRRLLLEASARYAAALDAPIERIRVFVHRVEPAGVAVGGEVVAETGHDAPYFEALMFSGRPPEQRELLLAGLTDAIVEVLDADRSLVRGMITDVDPTNWGIGGQSAAQVRAAEIAQRRSQ